MVVGETDTNLGVKFKPSVRSEHQDRRGAEWVLRGEEDAEVVESSFKLCTSGTTNGAVPFEYVVLERRGSVICGFVICQFLCLLEDSLHSRVVLVEVGG